MKGSSGCCSTEETVAGSSSDYDVIIETFVLPELFATELDRELVVDRKCTYRRSWIRWEQESKSLTELYRQARVVPFVRHCCVITLVTESGCNFFGSVSDFLIRKIRGHEIVKRSKLMLQIANWLFEVVMEVYDCAVSQSFDVRW